MTEPSPSSQYIATHFEPPWKAWKERKMTETDIRKLAEEIAALRRALGMAREALEKSLSAIKSLDDGALGYGSFTASDGEQQFYPLRDELLTNLQAALAACLTADGE